MTPSDDNRRWYDRMLTVDRRWIYVIMGIAVIIPAIWTFHVPVGVTKEVRAVHEFVDLFVV